MVNKSSDKTSDYLQLSILIAQDGFSFYLKNKVYDHSLSIPKLVVTDIESEDALSIFKKKFEHLYNKYTFDKIKLSFSNPYFSFVPSEYFDKSAITDYLKYNIELFKEDHIVSEKLENIDIHQVFIPLMDYHNLVLDYVEELEFEHFSNSLVLLCNSFEINNNDKQTINVFVHERQLEIIAFQNGEFKLCNYFTYDSETDIVYYILFCVEELGFDQNILQLDIYHSVRQTPWKQVLKNYIAHINFVEKNLAGFIS